jgi:hypothetical protein
MGDERDPLLLRPLSIGEIFDRAVTMLVRNWAPFAIIAAIGVVPGQITDYLAGAVNSEWSFVSVLLRVLVSVATMAAAIVVAQIYRNEDLDWRGAMLTALGRIPGILGVGFMMVFIAIIPVLVLVGIPAVLGVFKFGSPFAIVIAVLDVLVAGVVLVAITFSSSYAIAAMGIDQYHAPDAVGRALALFDRASAARTLLFALAQQLVVLGGGFTGGMLAGMGLALHQLALGNAIEGLTLFISTALGNVLIAVFYFDTAIRREGYDMKVALENMA